MGPVFVQNAEENSLKPLS